MRCQYLKVLECLYEMTINVQLGRASARQMVTKSIGVRLVKWSGGRSRVD